MGRAVPSKDSRGRADECVKVEYGWAIAVPVV